MNGLYNSGFVIRDTSSKPFKNSITDTGLTDNYVICIVIYNDLNVTTRARTEQNLKSV